MSDEINKESIRGSGFSLGNNGALLRQRLSRFLANRLNPHMFIAALATLLVAFLIDRGLSYGLAFAGVAAFLFIFYFTPLTVKKEKSASASRRERPTEDAPFLKELINGMPEAAVIINVDGLILYHNERAKSFCTMLKRGRHISTCIRNPNFLDAVSFAPTATRLQTVYFNQRIPVEQRIEATVAGIRKTAGTDKEIVYILVTLRDLSEQESLTRMRADFIANASHELRTPLASLQGFIETLQGPARDDAEARNRFLNIMAEQAKRMTRLIDDLLSLSRVEMKAHLFPEDKLELAELVNHVIDTMEPIANERDITIDYQPPTTAYLIRGDRDELVQVFQNLIQNAIKYGHDGGHVDVRMEPGTSTSNDMPRVRVIIKDDGPGIAPEHLPRLVERFYRVDVSDSRQKGGTGLGLAIVKHVLNRHRGELKITSAPGKGAIFSVELPLITAETEMPIDA